MSDKPSTKRDVLIAVMIVGYFGMTYPFINEDYSSGYQSIRDYFIFQNTLSAIFQVMLVLFGMIKNQTWMVSIRSSAFVWLFGTSVINIFLGLLSVWLILYSCIAGYLHITLYLEQTNSDRRYGSDDDYHSHNSHFYENNNRYAS